MKAKKEGSMKAKKVIYDKKYDPKRKGTFVIQYSMGKESYYREMAGPLPRFGAKLEDAKQFGTALEASDEMEKFPVTARVVSDIYEIVE